MKVIFQNIIQHKYTTQTITQTKALIQQLDLNQNYKPNQFRVLDLKDKSSIPKKCLQLEISLVRKRDKEVSSERIRLLFKKFLKNHQLSKY